MVKPFNLYTCCSNKKKKRSIKTNDNVAKTDVKRQTICSTISEFFSHDDLHPRNFVPCLILCLYSFAGAGIFFGIETLGSCPHDFWSSLFFVLTIYTSIGYGNIHPCAVGGKIFVIIYGMFGIPLALLVLDNLGRMMATYANFVWIKVIIACRSVREYCCEKKESKQREKGRALTKISETNDVFQGLPISVGILITIAWVLICATCFFEIENWYFGDAVYFMFISVTTIGFGDIVPQHLQYAVFYQFLLIIGLALFSMSINIVQLRLDALTESIVATIAKEYKECLFMTNEQGYSNIVNSSVPDHVNELISKQPNGRLLKYLLGKKARQILITLLERRINMKSKSCQTEITFKDVEVFTHDWMNMKSQPVQTNVTAGKWEWLW